MDQLTASAQEFVPKYYQRQQQHQQQHHQQQVHDGSLSAESREFVHRSDDVDESYGEFTRLKGRSCEPMPQRRTLGGSQLPPELRAHLSNSLKHSMAHLKPSDPRNKEVPKWFYSIYPLDDDLKKRAAAGTCGYPTAVFKVLNRKDGLVYALRRIDNVRGGASLNEQCDSALQLWRRVRHANVIPLRQAFSHQKAIFILHDYWPGARSVLEVALQNGIGNLLQERLIWSLLTQILTGLRAAHDQKVYFRGALGPTHILMGGKSRVRLAGAGLVHILEGAQKGVAEDPVQEDMMALSRTFLLLCCMDPQLVSNPASALDFVRSHYSPELLNIVALPFQRRCDVYDMLALCSHGLLGEVDELYSHVEALEDNLCLQLESSRLNRLMIKLNLVNERPEYGKSEASSWSETGDRYILKLFRDYVFHQTDEQGHPWLDVGHILTSLNKLDLGTDEKILLSSRDGRSILVVTFADVRKCLDEAFQELVEGHRSVQFYKMKRANPTIARAPEHTSGPTLQGVPPMAGGGIYAPPPMGHANYSQQQGMMYPGQDAMYTGYSQQQGGMY